MEYGIAGHNLNTHISLKKIWLVNYFFFPVDKQFTNCYINRKAEKINKKIEQHEQPYIKGVKI